MQAKSERYALAVKAASHISTNKVLTVSMIAVAAERAGVDPAIWFPPLLEVARAVVLLV